MTNEKQILNLVSDGFYRIDEHGQVWRTQSFGRTGKRRAIDERRAETLCKSGYLDIRVNIAGTAYRARAHRIVWIWARGPIPDGLNINHENGDKTDNRLKNLSVVTQAENIKHAYDSLGRPAAAGERNGRAKLSQDQIGEIRRLYAAGGHSWRSLGRTFGVSHRQIGYIVKGDRWPEFPA